jgi:hypothetical protein
MSGCLLPVAQLALGLSTQVHLSARWASWPVCYAWALAATVCSSGTGNISLDVFSIFREIMNWATKAYMEILGIFF